MTPVPYAYKKLSVHCHCEKERKKRKRKKKEKEETFSAFVEKYGQNGKNGAMRFLYNTVKHA